MTTAVRIVDQLDDLADFTSGDSLVSSVADYAAMKAYAGEAEALVVTDSRYGGLFRKVSGSVTENGATEIPSTALASTYWKRVYDERAILPEFFDIGGGVGFDGTAGAVNAEADAIREAAFLAQASGVQKAIELTPLKTYEIDRTISIQDGFLKGNGATLKWILSPAPALSSAAPAGPGPHTLQFAGGTDLSKFRSNQEVTITDVGATNGGEGFAENHSSNPGNWNILIISSVDDGNDQITVTGTIDAEMPSGSKVWITGNMAEASGDVKVENLTFDRLWSDTSPGGSNQEDGYPSDWRDNHAILQQDNGFLILDNCKFNNHVGETIQMQHGRLDRCDFSNLAGSVVHFTNTIVDAGSSNITDCEWENTNVLGDAVMDHSEGAITFSNKVTDVFVSGCRGKDMGEAVVGNISAVHGRFHMDNCDFRGAKNIVTSRAPAGEVNSFSIKGCRFASCGDILLWSDNAWFTKTDPFDFFDWEISDCRIVNGRIGILGGHNLTIRNVRMWYNEGLRSFTGWTDWLDLDTAQGGSSPGTKRGAYITVDRSRNVTIDNCKLHAPPIGNSSRDFVPHGIALDNNAHVSDAGDGYWYTDMPDVRVTNCVIDGFEWGLGPYQILPTSGNGGIGDSVGDFVWPLVGHVYDNVTVVMPRTLDDTSLGNGIYRYGICAGPGVIVQNCQVFKPRTVTSGTGAAFLGIGPDRQSPTGNLGAHEVYGPVLKNNVIWPSQATGVIDCRLGIDDQYAGNFTVMGNVFGNNDINSGASDTGNVLEMWETGGNDVSAHRYKLTDSAGDTIEVPWNTAFDWTSHFEEMGASFEAPAPNFLELEETDPGQVNAARADDIE